MKRRLFQGLLIVALLCGAVLLAHPSAAWAVTPSQPTQDSNGVYQIGSAEELYWFAGLVNGDTTVIGTETQQNTAANAVLTRDIVLNTGLDQTKFAVNDDGALTYDGSLEISFTQWTPIGDNNNRYTGTFDGAGYEISGLYINDSTAKYIGLFGFIGTDVSTKGTVKNITLTDSYINSNSGNLNVYVGGICGMNSGGTITNCDNSGDFNGIYVGGICGRNGTGGSITNCSNNGSISNSNSGRIGGICGHNNSGSITNCSNSGPVTGSAHVGGICGDNDNGRITSCSNSGPVTGSGSRIGGICGWNRNSGISGNLSTSSITNCSNSGDVTGSYTGGICGQNDDGSITNCYWLEGTAGVGIGDDGTAIAKTAEQYASGEVAWLLNQWSGDGVLNGKVWAMGEDGYPVLNGESDNTVVKLTFDANTGNAADNVIRYANTGAALPSVKEPERAGYTFTGWNTKADGSGTSAPEIKLDADITLYAQWEKAVYTVTLHANGGTVNSGNVTNYTYGTATALPTAQDITRTGYTFGGWYENEALSGEPETAIPADATGAKTYYAKWTANTYTVTLNANGGTINSGNITGYTYGTETTLPTAQDITRTGYTFAGWYDNEALSGEPETVIPADATGDKTYWAKWTAKSYPSAPPTVSEKIIDAIKAADPGETVTVDLSSGSTKLDKEVFETLAGKDVTLVIDLGDDVSWTVKGSDVPEDADFTDIDMGVTMNSDGIPVDVVNAITGERSSVQITLAHDGAFGFTMTLTAPLGTENAGLWANLYHFNEDANAMTFETAAPIGSDGSVSLALSHASQYAIVIDDHNHGVVELPFTDVADSDWFYDPVCFVYSQGLMTGTSATTFEPNISLSRAMLVAVLHRLEGSPAASAGDFTDVADGDWYAQAVSWAASVGVVNGFDDGTFQPNAAITREQMAAILCNYAQYKGFDTSASGDLSTYSDAASVSDWAQESVEWMVGSGLLGGYDDNTLRPQGTTTRAEVASVLQRALGNVAGNQ